MAEKNNRLAAIRAKFQGKAVGFVPTPENQFGRIKKSNEDNAKAIRIAKARAARYNMTLRALALKTPHDVSKNQKKDISTKKKVKKEHSKYKATSRSLNVVRGTTAKDQNNIAKALDPNVSPSIAKTVIKAVATRQTEKPVIDEDDDIKTDDDEDEVKLKEEKKVAVTTEPKKKVEMSGMHEALANGDDQALNRAILANFLSVHAPALEGKTDELLDQFSTSLDSLFKKLLKKFPDEADAKISGQQKADKEIAEAVENGDVKLSKEEKVEEDEDDDDDDSSLVMDEAGIDKYEETDEKPKPDFKIEDLNLDDVTDDSDSMVELQDENFKEGYDKAMKKAEKGDKGVIKALARRRTTMKLNDDLEKEVERYKQDERKSFKSLKTLDEDEDDDSDSLVETPYITNLEEAAPVAEVGNEEEAQPTRWAVQFENKNIALKKKLMKQGLSKEQVSNLVDNLEENTSEMI